MAHHENIAWVRFCFLPGLKNFAFDWPYSGIKIKESVEPGVT